MSAKRWADEYSSDEGSVDGSDEESEPLPARSAAPKASTTAPTKISQPSHDPTPSTPVYIAHVSNINAAATRKDVGNFFEGKGCKISNLDVHPTQDKNSTATLGFKDAESLSIALSLNGELFQGLQIRTKVYEARISQAHGQGQQGGRGQGRGDGGRGGFRDSRDNRQDQRTNHREEDRFPGRRQETGRGGRGGAGTSRERAAPAPAAPAVPTTRPKLVLAPRTLPVQNIGKVDETKPDIFGGGKPHDEILYEVRFVSLKIW
jgi:hypothetical protein